MTKDFLHEPGGPRATELVHNVSNEWYEVVGLNRKESLTPYSIYWRWSGTTKASSWYTLETPLVGHRNLETPQKHSRLQKPKYIIWKNQINTFT